MDLVHVRIRGAGFVPAAVPAVLRVLVAIEPHMYREVVAFHFRQKRPRADVVLASPQILHDEARRTRPHLIFTDEVPPEFKEKGVFWVEVRMEDGLVATISADGYSDTIDDVSLQDLLAVVDKAEEALLAHDDEE
jgi:hypothetical protein